MILFSEIMQNRIEKPGWIVLILIKKFRFENIFYFLYAQPKKESYESSV